MKDLRIVLNDIVDLVCPLFTEEMASKVKKDGAIILNTISENEHIKVPIVGDFNAGKTSLVNALLEEDGLLPEATKPETAIPCEIQPIGEGEKAHIKVFRYDDIIYNGTIDEYKSVQVFPGDYSILYTSSSRIKKWYDKGITLVDMPGVSSGLKEHNEAILRYISQGTIYALLVDSVNGSISESGINFLKEIMQYGLNVGIFISRTDLPSSKNLTAIKDYISSQIEHTINTGNIGIISAKKNNISDFEDFIEGINTGLTCYKKTLPLVKAFLADQITVLNEIHAALASTTDLELEERINSTQEQIEQINLAITESLESVDSPEQSTNDILNSLSAALRNNAEYIADVYISNSAGNRLSAVNEALIGIIRPALLKSFKEEQDEFIATLNTKINDLTERLLTTIQMPQGLLDELVSQNQVAIIQGIRLVAEKLMQSDNPYAQILGQCLNFFAESVPDLIKEFLGKNNDNKLKHQLEEQVRGPICKSITVALKNPIEQHVRLMQTQIIAATRKQYEQRINQLETLLRELRRQREDGIQQNTDKSSQCLEAINQLETLNETLMTI